MSRTRWSPHCFRLAFLALLVLLHAGSAGAQQLFVGLEVSNLATRTSDLAGFPNVSWTNRFVFEVSGAAARPDGYLFLCNGPFTTHLYGSTVQGPPQLLCTTSVDLQGLGYGSGRLYGYSNYASPMGIYEVDPATGACVLRVSTAGPGYRFFGLDFNDADGLLYGYTEYGVSGLYWIDPGSGAMARIVGPPPGVNGQGRALAVGQNTVYLLATRGDEGEPVFAYDLGQGVNGVWVGFTNPYPTQHASGGAAWIPGTSSVKPVARPTGALWMEPARPNPTSGFTMISWTLAQPATVRLEIFNTAGRLVTRLLDGPCEAGTHAVSWGGRTDAGLSAATGCYLVRLSAGPESRTRMVTILR